MKTAISIISTMIITTSFFTLVSANSKETAFTNMSLLTAKDLAAVESKLVYVDFYADWCVPCNWMSETTYSEAGVISALQSNFVPVRVNIDDFDGFALKEEYRIRVLPTILILDENGRVISRLEESLTPDKLKDILTRVNNKTDYDNSRELNVSPSMIDNTFSENHSTVKTTTMKYRVQVGVFSDYANTERVLKRLYDNFNEPVVVVTDFLDNRTVYRVFAGDCETQEEADKLRDEIERKIGIKGFVKAFETQN